MEKEFIISGRYLKLIRMEIGAGKITQVEMAKKLGISQSYMSALEGGYKKVSETILYKFYLLCEENGLDFDVGRLKNKY